VFGAEIAQAVVLFASGEVGDVGDDPMVASGKQVRGLSDALGNHGGFLLRLLLIVALLLFQRLFQRGGKLVPSHEPGGFGGCRVEQTSQHWRVLEAVVHPVHGDAQVVPAHRQTFPFIFGHADRQTRAGDIQLRQWPVATGAGVGPSGQGEGEGGEFDTARVEFEAVEVLAQHRIHRVRRGEVLKFHAHGHKHQESRHEKVARTAAWVENLQFSKLLRPMIKGSTRRHPKSPSPPGEGLG